jgi:hypothetical protein
MGVREWSKGNFEYGRKVLNFGLEGAHSGREAFLEGRPLTPFFRESICNAWTPTVIGACLGVRIRLSRRCHRVWPGRRMGEPQFDGKRCPGRAAEHRQGARRTLAGESPDRLCVKKKSGFADSRRLVTKLGRDGEKASRGMKLLNWWEQ